MQHLFLLPFFMRWILESRWWSWMNSTIRKSGSSVMVSLSAKMPSITCIHICCPQHKPSCTITPPPSAKLQSKQPSTFCCKTVIHPWTEHLSKVQNVGIGPLKSVTMTTCNEVETPVRVTSMQASISDSVWPLVQKFFHDAHQMMHCCSCLGGWAQTVLGF